MKLIMGVSKDGYVARKTNDDMSWLGASDKAAFRILSSMNGGVVGVSRTTAACMPSELPGRSLLVLSTTSCALAWGSLLDFHRAYPGGHLLGGQGLALVALREGYIDEVQLCRSSRYAFPDMTNGAIPDRITMELYIQKFTKAMDTKFGDTTVECWRK